MSSGQPGFMDPTAQMAQLLQQQINARMDAIEREYRARLDHEVEEIAAGLERRAKGRFYTLLTTVVAVFIGLSAVFLYTQAKSANDTFIGFQNSVIRGGIKMPRSHPERGRMTLVSRAPAPGNSHCTPTAPGNSHCTSTTSSDSR
jgi:hypothetical protein